MTLGTHLVEHHACDVQRPPAQGGTGKGAEAVDEWRHAIGRGLGIHQQHHGQTKQRRHLGTAAKRTVITVEESHHTLGHTDIRPLAIAMEERPYMLGRGEERIEVHALAPGSQMMKEGVDIVWATLVGLHTQIAATQRTQHPHRKGGLTTARRGSTYQKSMVHCASRSVR